MAGSEGAAWRERITRHAALLAGWPPDALGPLLRAVERSPTASRPRRVPGTTARRDAVLVAGPSGPGAITTRDARRGGSPSEGHGEAGVPLRSGAVARRHAAALAAPHVAEAVTALGEALRMAQDALMQDDLGPDALHRFLAEVQGRPVPLPAEEGRTRRVTGAARVRDGSDGASDRESAAIMVSHVLISDFLAHQDADRIHVLRRMAPSSSPFWLRALALVGLEIGLALLFRAALRRLRVPVA